MKQDTVLETAKVAIRSEIDALESLLQAIDENFVKVVDLISCSLGRVMITGVGKSGHVGNKIAATLASLGTPSYFVHATEGVHGDLGMITSEDIVIAISNSGQTRETLDLISPIRRIGAKLVAVTSRPDSELARQADLVLNIGVQTEADPLGLAPTNSTTATLVLGDALAITLSVNKKFTQKDFGKFHPGGSLGKKIQEEKK
ncbi:KpsF/GutQ family sugar-phosphate isomerase [Candidatus Poribacteria bacterium]|nr:KpsF/GutQ family sugar-phosphate isomerase [Candidatus Poribacteria bacterium]